MKKTRKPRIDLPRLLTLHKEGKTVLEIVKELGCTYTTVFNRIKEFKAKNRNEKAKDVWKELYFVFYEKDGALVKFGEFEDVLEAEDKMKEAGIPSPLVVFGKTKEVSNISFGTEFFYKIQDK